MPKLLVRILQTYPLQTNLGIPFKYTHILFKRGSEVFAKTFNRDIPNKSLKWHVQVFIFLLS
jgi:hypothetical protein